MAEGCSDGNRVFPNTTNRFDIPFNPRVERFSNTNPIIIRNWEGDPVKCGILRSKLMRTGKPCFIGEGFLFGYGEGIVEYNPMDNTCAPPPVENADLDTLTPALLTVMTALVLLRPKRLLRWFNK